MARNQYPRRKLSNEELIVLRGLALSQNKVHPEMSADEDIQADLNYSFFSLALSGLPDLIDEVLRYRSRKGRPVAGKKKDTKGKSFALINNTPGDITAQEREHRVYLSGEDRSCNKVKTCPTRGVMAPTPKSRLVRFAMSKEICGKQSR